MQRLTLYRGESAAQEDATEQIRSTGARIIAMRPGLALVEASEQAAAQLRTALPGWQISDEKKAQVPRPRPTLPKRSKGSS